MPYFCLSYGAVLPGAFAYHKRKHLVFPGVSISFKALACGVFFVLAGLFLSFSARAAEAQSASPSTSPWQATLSGDEALPPRVIAVDKSGQRLFLVEGSKDLRVSRTYICTTGQVVGDKQVEGDLKTPEGVYFVVGRIGSGLEYLLYGNEAYTLNFPNPVDKLRRKTGYGIWIHGRGEAIRPLQTQGCVAMNNEDLAVLGKLLVPGTPVTLTETFTPQNSPGATERKQVAALKKSVQDWATAWENRSPAMFEFYDKQSYAIAQGESFSTFQTQKERLFKSLPWIKTSVHDVQVLPGPGYWVTWFFQDYSAPNLSTKGVRRLYWQENAKGEFKIVGMEWIPGMTTSLTLASAGDSHPQEEGRQEGGGQLISEEQAIPLATAQAAAGQGRTPTGAASGGTPTAGAVATSLASPGLDHVEDPKFGLMAEPPQAAALRTAKGKGPGDSILLAVQSGGLSLPPALPSQGLAGSSGTVTAERDTPRTDAPPAQGTPQTTARTDTPPAASTPRTADAAGQNGPAQEPLGHASTGQEAPQQGQPGASTASSEKTPVLDEATGSSEETPVPGGAEALAATRPGASGSATQTADAPSQTPVLPGKTAQDAGDAGTQIRNLVESWRAAWQSGDVGAYMAFYGPRAVQGSRSGTAGIRTHKVRLWAKAAPQKVVLSDIDVAIDGDSAAATMVQEYTDVKGDGDKGMKTLVFERSGNAWYIVMETWSAVP